MLLMSLCWSDMSSMPQRLTVAGDAYCRLSHSKMKLTLLANWMRSPLGMVSNLQPGQGKLASALVMLL